jgi:two-component system phosphate regulon response regulator PhoB
MKRDLILVIEDEREIRELISLHLLRNGYGVQAVSGSDEAQTFLKGNDPDLIILDWMLPDQSGVEFLKEYRNTPAGKSKPVLMVTAKTDPEDVVYALDAGADDYIIKPFDSTVLMARVKALLRRASQEASGNGVILAKENQTQFQIGKLQIDSAAHKVSCDCTELDLTPNEFKLLLALMKQAGRVMTREKLLKEVQGEDVKVIERTVDTHLFALRKKLGSCSEYVETIRGVGYRFREVISGE